MEIDNQILDLQKQIIALKEENKSLKAVIKQNKITYKGVEENPNVNNSLWKKMLDKLPIGIYINGKHKNIFVNSAVESILGYSKEEYLNFSYEDIQKLCKFDNHKYEQPSSEIFNIDENTNYEIFEYQMKTKSGEWKWFLSFAIPFEFEENGELFSIIGCSIDISKRKQLEEEILLSNQKLEEAYKNETKLLRQNAFLLEREIEQKNKELAGYALYLLEKNECLRNVKFKAMEIAKSDDKFSKKILSDLIKSTDEKLKRDNSWQKYEEMFRSLDPLFLKTITTSYPDLSQMEMKISSLIKLQMSTNQIATILNLSPRTIEYHKYNIHKKMKLTKGESIVKRIMCI